jgi:hypothetical protein
MDLIAFGAHDGSRQLQASFVKAFAEVSVATDVWDTPILQSPGKAMIGIIVNHHHRRTTQMELFDCPETHPLETAYDDVVSHTPTSWGLHRSMLPT